MARIVWVRPAQSEWDEQGRLRGNLDVPLSEDGRSHAAGVGRELARLNPSIILCGKSQTIRETADIISAGTGDDGIGVRTHEMFNDVNLGLWQGLKVADVKRKHPKVFRQWKENPALVQPPGGESFEQVRARAKAGLALLGKKHPDGVTVVVCQDVIGALICSMACGTGLEETWRQFRESSKTTWRLFEA